MIELTILLPFLTSSTTSWLDIDHIDVLLDENFCCKADDKEEGGRDEDGQESVHYGTAHRRPSNNRFFVKKPCSAHFDLGKSVTIQRYCRIEKD